MRPTLDPALAPFGTTIFSRMSALATQHGAINLGQGFPDEDAPPALLDGAVRAVRAGHNQYPPAGGDPALTSAVAAHQRHWYGLDLDPASQILVTFGATEALSATMLALLRRGDEVVMFEPYYDAYAAAVAVAGGVRRTSVLRPPEFAVDEASLRKAITERTRIIVLNTPHNPTGKVFPPAELEVVARVAVDHDLLVVTDEVYEHLIYDGARHVPIAALPGMAERTLTISSAGKTFAATGWKVGWITGPADLVAAVRTVKQYLSFSGAAPLQPAVAAGLALPDDAFTAYAADLARRRDLLCDALAQAGLEPGRPRGTYFVLADVTPLGVTDAAAFCEELPRRCGVAAIPVSAFCDSPGFETLVRFAFCKRDDLLVEAARRLARLG